jgi:hypothetical protein
VQGSWHARGTGSQRLIKHPAGLGIFLASVCDGCRAAGFSSWSLRRVPGWCGLGRLGGEAINAVPDLAALDKPDRAHGRKDKPAARATGSQLAWRQLQGRIAVPIEGEVVWWAFRAGGRRGQMQHAHRLRRRACGPADRLAPPAPGLCFSRPESSLDSN